MLRRMDSEEKRRNDAELAAAEAKAKAEAAKASAPSDPFLAATSSTGGSLPSSSSKKLRIPSQLCSTKEVKQKNNATALVYTSGLQVTSEQQNSEASESLCTPTHRRHRLRWQ